MLALAEIGAACISEARPLVKWLVRLGYRAKVLPNTAAKSRGGEADALLIAVKAEKASIKEMTSLGEKVMGVQIVAKSDAKSVLRLAVMHGLHGGVETDEGFWGSEDVKMVSYSFVQQLADARSFVGDGG